jgi:predicted Mrr-cat superfamily restriction endonuclease
MTDKNNTIIVPIGNLNYEEVMLIIDILKRRYPKPTPMIKEIVVKLEERIQDYLEFLKIYGGTE